MMGECQGVARFSGGVGEFDRIVCIKYAVHGRAIVKVCRTGEPFVAFFRGYLKTDPIPMNDHGCRRNEGGRGMGASNDDRTRATDYDVSVATDSAD